MIIRKIEKSDNKIIAGIIRSSLEAYGLNIPGTVYTDPTTDDLFSLFQNDQSVYFIAEDSSGIKGGCGMYPTENLPEGCIELVKLYLVQTARGIGLGRTLMETCIEWAREQGHKQVYLETFPELASAVKLYEKLGFKHLNGPLGNSGHTACTIWMVKDLNESLV